MDTKMTRVSNDEYAGWTLWIQVQSNVSVEMGIVWGISVHSIHKGEVFSSVYM